MRRVTMETKLAPYDPSEIGRRLFSKNELTQRLSKAEYRAWLRWHRDAPAGAVMAFKRINGGVFPLIKGGRDG